MTTPEVSVILPTFNGSEFIKKAIQSVLNQSFSNFELLIIDDGSKDSIPEITNYYVEKDARVFYARNENNLGIQQSLNRGLKIARGKYIARIDDDDEWIDRNKLKRQVEYLNKNPDYILIGTGTIVVDENGKEIFRFLNPESDQDIRKKILFKNYFTHSGVIFKKKAAMKFNGYDESEQTRHIEDYDLWLKLGTLGKFGNLPIYGVKFTQRSGAISSKNKIKQFKRNIKIIQKFSDFYPSYSYALIFGYIRFFLYVFFIFFSFSLLKNRFLKIYKNY